MQVNTAKVAKDKPLITDYELVGELLIISAVTKALAKDMVKRSTYKNSYMKKEIY